MRSFFNLLFKRSWRFYLPILQKDYWRTKNWKEKKEIIIIINFMGEQNYYQDQMDAGDITFEDYLQEYREDLLLRGYTEQEVEAALRAQRGELEQIFYQVES